MFLVFFDVFCVFFSRKMCFLCVFCCFVCDLCVSCVFFSRKIYRSRLEGVAILGLGDVQKSSKTLLVLTPPPPPLKGGMGGFCHVGDRLGVLPSWWPGERGLEPESTEC